MGRLVLRSLVCLVVIILCAGLSVAAVPSTINVQGKLTDSGGLPLPAGAKTFTFRIFNAAGGGTKVWPAGAGEVQSVTTSTEGLWTALVGAVEPLNQSVFADTVRWLEIEVDATILPRVRLLTGPYAHRVGTVDGASGGTITSKVSIGPGHSNSGGDAFVAGSGNTVSSGGATIPGGVDNTVSGFAGVIGGGQLNSVSANYANIGGGFLNSASAIGATVAGGQSNMSLAMGAAIGGGDGNITRGLYSVIAGGGGSQSADSNAARGDWSFIGGGHHNIADGDSSVVAGGTRNTASGKGAVVVGGADNHARGAFSFVGGGGGMFADSNSALGQFSVAVGGNHSIATGEFTFVGGGYVNHADGDYSSIVGGYVNSTNSSGDYKFIGGGRVNAVNAGSSSIVGGDSNTVSGGVAFIGGGRRNSVAGSLSAVLGGQRNSVGGAESVCIGGREDTANAAFSVTLGGYRNRTGASAKYSMASGKRAKADHAGTFVWADSTDADFASSGINQFLIRAAGGVGVGTASPEGPLHIQKGSAGAVTANSNSIAVFETSSANGWLSILGPDNAERGLIFTEPSSAVAGAIVFDQGGGGNDIGFRTGGNVTNMTLDASGNLTVVGCVDGNNTACASDARFKKNIETVANALGLIDRLRGVRYEWRADEFPDRHFESGAQYGVIAQEVREVLPEVIREREDGYLSVEYNALVPLLIEAIKEQQRQIDQLQRRLDHQTP